MPTSPTLRSTIEVARRNTPAELVAQVQHPVSHDRKRELRIGNSFASVPRNARGCGVFRVGEPWLLPQWVMRAAARAADKRPYGKYLDFRRSLRAGLPSKQAR
jgi:hypothetical protein